MISLLTSNWSDTGDPRSRRRPARTTCRARSARRGTAADDRRSTASPASSHGQSGHAASSRRQSPQEVDVRYTRSTRQLCRALPHLLRDRCAGRAPSGPGKPQRLSRAKCATAKAGSPSAAACGFRYCGVPPSPVRGCTRNGPPGSPRPRTYGGQRRRGEADPVVFVQVMAIWWGAEERSVKPSAQPTLVRTQHLPPPAKTARWLRKRGPAGRFLLVTPCIRVRHYGSMHGSVHVHMVYSVRAKLAVRITAPFVSDGRQRRWRWCAARRSQAVPGVAVRGGYELLSAACLRQNCIG